MPHISRFALVGLAACAATTPPPAPTAPPTPITRTLLQHADVAELPGWETRLYLIEYGPGVAAPLHHHPVVGIGYVLGGSFASAFEGEAEVTVAAGAGFVDRALAPHTVFRNVDAARPLRFLIAYTVRKDAPVLETP